MSASLRNVPKTVKIGLLGAAPQIGEILPQNFSHYTLLYLTLPYLTLPYLTLPFFLLYASTAQTAEPICMHDSSNDAVCCKEVPFGGRVYTKLPPKTPNFGTGMPNFHPNQYTRITFER